MKRNYGIDLLRMLSMFMVAVLHVLGQGGVLYTVESLSLKYWLAWFLEIACICAVNCFALISGYVMYTSKAKLSRALNLWLQVAFYTIGALAAFWILKPEAVSLKMIADAVFPVSRGHYWYISAYFGLLVLQPLLNIILEHAEKKVLETVFVTIVVVLCTIPNFLLSDPYVLVGGYSTIWLVILYLAGGYIRKYDVVEKAKKSTGWWMFGIGLLITFGFKMAVELFPQDILPLAKLKNVLFAYQSPTVIMMAVGLLIALSKQNFGKFSARVITVCAPAALGIYLVHTNLLVWKYILDGLFVDLVSCHWAVMVLLVIGAAIAIYVLCTLVELVRIWLFKLVKIPALCEKLESWIQKLLNKFVPV